MPIYLYLSIYPSAGHQSEPILNDNLGVWLDATGNKECSRINANELPKGTKQQGLLRKKCSMVDRDRREP